MPEPVPHLVPLPGGLMRVLIGCLLLVLLLPSPAVLAAEEAPPVKPPGVQITFLPPPMEGTLSLGLFNREKRLARALHQEAEEKEFTAGLNGFITRWDGNDDTGNPAPPGKYTARGYSVGELDVEGVAYHCNEWITDETSPRFREFDVTLLTTGELLLTVLPPGSREGQRIATHRFNPETETWNVEAAAAEGEERTASTSQSDDQSGDLQRHIVTFPNGKPSLRLEGAKISIKQGEDFKELPLSLTRPIAASHSRSGGLWVLDVTAEGTEVKEFSLSGEHRRQLIIDKSEPQPVDILASPERERIYLLEKGEQVIRLRGLELEESSAQNDQPKDEPQISLWKTVFSKTLRRSDNFDQVADKLGRPQPFKPEGSITVKLRPNPLFKDKPTTIDLQIAVDEKGSYFRTSDGLPLCRIAETPHLKWAVMGREGKDKAVTVFQSDGTVVEEFRIRKPANMMAFDAGEYEWKPQAAK